MPYEFDAEARQKGASTVEQAAPAQRSHTRPLRQRRPSQMGKIANVPEAPKAQFIADSVDPDFSPSKQPAAAEPREAAPEEVEAEAQE